MDVDQVSISSTLYDKSPKTCKGLFLTGKPEESPEYHQEWHPKQKKLLNPKMSNMWLVSDMFILSGFPKEIENISKASILLLSAGQMVLGKFKKIRLNMISDI